MNPYFEKVFPKKQMEEILTAYEAATGLHTQLIDEKGVVLFSAGTRTEFCQCFIRNIPTGDSCTAEHAKAGREAMRFGEAYMHTCHAGLYHIAFPIISNNEIYGSVISGPFLMDEPDGEHLIKLNKRYHFQTEILLELAEKIHGIKIISPEEATQYSRLLYYLIGGLATGNKEILMFNQRKLLQQSRINEAIQAYKKGGLRDFNEYPFEKEKELITRIKTGNTEEARKILNELLAYILLHESHDLRTVRIRVIELCVLLSRVAIEKGADTAIIMQMNSQLIQSLIEAKDVYEISYSFQENLEIYTGALFFHSEQSSRIVKKAAEFIHAHFAEEISLKEVAETIHVNASYLSTQFRQVTGVTYKEYLNRVRVEEAERLLKNTDYSIMDITIACGFSDQSYFTKVFKKITGRTPKQSR